MARPFAVALGGVERLTAPPPAQSQLIWFRRQAVMCSRAMTFGER